MGIGRFYAFVVALLWFPPHAKYLLLKRSADKDFGGGAWECVTGRVDQGEGFSEAVRREVYEELGVEVHVDFIIGTGHFYRGEARPENEMVGVQYCCSIDDPDSIQVSAEHSEYRWVTAQEAHQFLPDGHWLRATIARAEDIRALLSPQMLEFNRTQGLEL